jgi:hypothetical protein
VRSAPVNKVKIGDQSGGCNSYASQKAAETLIS